MDTGLEPRSTLRSRPPAEPGDRLRVGLLCPYSLTIPGGVQGQVMGLARSLRRLGHEVRVLGPCDGAPPDSFVTPIGESLPTAANGSVAPLAPDPSAALRTIRVLRDEGFDVLHLHEPLTPGPNLTALVMRMAPIVGTFHAAGDSLSYRYLNGPLRGFASAIDVRTAVSKDAVALAQRYLGGEYEILPNGVEIERFARTCSRSDDQRDRQRSIFFCGRHEPRKGLEILLRAHRSMQADVELWIASDGPETERLRREYGADPRVSWLGRISDVEKADLLRSSSVFCAPSLGGESFGVVLIEAMAAGTPVVASALDGYMNVATDGIDAVLVEPGEVESLTSALLRVLTDSSLAAGLVESGFRRAQEFSMDAVAQRYVELYRSVIANHTSDRSVATSFSRSFTGAFPAEIGDLAEFVRRLRITLRSVLGVPVEGRVAVGDVVRRFVERLGALLRRMLAR